MYNVELYARVRRACMVEGMSVREASRVFGLHRDTVRKMLAYSVPPGYRRQDPPRRPKLAPFTGVIDGILEADRRVPRNLSQHGLSRLQLQRLAALEAAVPQRQQDQEDPRSETPRPREATPSKQALWKAVHHARLQGVSLRGIARELGISRNTVRKYVDSLVPSVNRTPWRSTQSPTRQNAGGHFP